MKRGKGRILGLLLPESKVRGEVVIMCLWEMPSGCGKLRERVVEI